MTRAKRTDDLSHLSRAGTGKIGYLYRHFHLTITPHMSENQCS